MSLSADSVRAKNIGRELTRLLTQERVYRQKWLKHVIRERAHEINLLAVAKHLHQQVDHDSSGNDYVALKDRVRRALRGTSISPETLRLFIEAFALTDADAAKLWNLYDPTTIRDDIIKGSLPSRSLGTPSQRSTLHLTDEHHIGYDRLPSKHLTTQVIQSNQESLTHLTLFTDTDEVDLFVEAGGVRRKEPSSDGSFPAKVVIKLDSPLNNGQQTLVRYGFKFRYQEPPRPLFSRVARHAIHHLSILVKFHPQALPIRVWWRVWSDYGHTNILFEEPVLPDSNHQVFRHLGMLQDAVAGFEWEWS